MNLFQRLFKRKKKEEKQILRTLNQKIFVERLKYKYNHWKEKRLYGEDSSLA